MRAIAIGVAGLAVLVAAGCQSAAASGIVEPPLPGMVEIAPEAVAHLPLAERPGTRLGIVLEDGSVLTAPSRSWTGEPLRIASLTSDATATATRVLDWSLGSHWVRLDAEWRTGAPVPADLGPAPAPGDPLRIHAVRRDLTFEFLEPRRLRASASRAPSLLHSANVIFREPAAAKGTPAVDEAGRVVALVGDVATSTGVSLRLGLVPLKTWHQATLRIATFPDPWPDAEPLPLEGFTGILARRDEIDRRLDTGRTALEEHQPHIARAAAAKILARDPRSIRAMTLRAEADMAAGDWSAAIELLRIAIPREARPLALEGLLAECLLRRGDRDESIALARRIAASAAPDEVTALQRAAYVLEEAGATAEAAGIYRRILEAQPRHAAATAALDRLGAP